MAERSTVARNATASSSACDLPETFTPGSLSPTQLKRQIALYIEATALLPLLSSGIGLEQVAETFIELAVQGVQRSSGRVAAAVMLQKATRLAFESALATEQPRLLSGMTTRRL